MHSANPIIVILAIIRVLTIHLLTDRAVVIRISVVTETNTKELVRGVGMDADLREGFDEGIGPGESNRILTLEGEERQDEGNCLQRRVS
jgi:hypothetical protein